MQGARQQHPCTAKEGFHRHRAEPGTTNTPDPPRPLLCDVVKPLPKREVVAEAPELLRLIVPSPKRCVVVVDPLESRLIVPLPKRLVVTVWPSRAFPEWKRELFCSPPPENSGAPARTTIRARSSPLPMRSTAATPNWLLCVRSPAIHRSMPSSNHSPPSPVHGRCGSPRHSQWIRRGCAARP